MISSLFTILICGYSLLNPTPLPPPQEGGAIYDEEGTLPPHHSPKIATAKVKAGIPVNSDSSLNTRPVKILNGNVAVIKELPPQFYGEWKVASEVLDTNNTDHWGEIGLNYWTFDRTADTITLTNPETGATASITVTEVVGNKATFTRQRISPNKIVTETVEVTVNSDKFSGTDKQVTKFLSGNRKTDVVKYRVVGQKINGTTMRQMFAK